MRRSLKKEEVTRRKGEAFPHCAAAQPLSLIEGRNGTVNISALCGGQAANTNWGTACRARYKSSRGLTRMTQIRICLVLIRVILR
jgi:hypothetical protein